MSVASGARMNAREIDATGHRQHRREDLRAADDRDLVDTACRGAHARNVQRLRDASRTLDTGNIEIRTARDDDVVAAIERLADRVECLATHDHRLAHGEAAEDLQVGRHAPWDCAVATDDAVLGDGNDEGDDRFSPTKRAVLLAAACGPLMRFGWLPGV